MPGEDRIGVLIELKEAAGGEVDHRAATRAGRDLVAGEDRGAGLRRDAVDVDGVAGGAERSHQLALRLLPPLRRARRAARHEGQGTDEQRANEQRAKPGASGYPAPFHA